MWPPALLVTALLVASRAAHAAGSVTSVVGSRQRRYVCPDLFVRNGNSCYYLSRYMATWHDAHFNCRDMGSQLARLEKKWEDRNMRAYLNRTELARLERWIGGIYDWESRMWIWGATGQRVVYHGFSRRRPGENHRWHCIVLDPTMFYKWSTRNCYARKHYICETPLKRIKPPQPVATTVPETDKLSGKGRGKGKGRGRGKGRGEGGRGQGRGQGRGRGRYQGRQSWRRKTATFPPPVPVRPLLDNNL